MNLFSGVLLWVVACVAATLVGMFSMMGLHHFSGFLFPEAAMSMTPKDPIELDSFLAV